MFEDYSSSESGEVIGDNTVIETSAPKKVRKVRTKKENTKSQCQIYWDKFGPELYDDATKPIIEGRMSLKELMVKYSPETDNGKLSRYMVKELVMIGKRLEGVAF